MELTAARLREVLDYDPETGVFRWRERKNKNGDGRGLWKLKRDVGTYSMKGYLTVEIGGRNYQSHRLAWLHVTGKWPKDQIDHINGIRDDNRFLNLREATAFENTRNAKAKKNNKTGLKGVSRRQRISGTFVFVARIHLENKRVHLGCFKTAEEASRAYIESARKHFGEFARLT